MQAATQQTSRGQNLVGPELAAARAGKTLVIGISAIHTDGRSHASYNGTSHATIVLL